MLNLSTIENDMRYIADMLILNGTLTDCPGLINGKTGISIFFFHYARHTNNIIFEEYAMELIKEIQSQIHKNSPVDYERGIAGIGVGMDYLIKNNFFHVDEDFFKDFDEKIYYDVMYNKWSDFSLYDGLIGYGRYWIMRYIQDIQNRKAMDCILNIIRKIEMDISEISTEEFPSVIILLSKFKKNGFRISSDLMKSIIKVNLDFPYLTDSTVSEFVRKYQRNCCVGDYLHNNVYMDLKKVSDLNKKKQSITTGLLTGYAGEGLLRLTAINKVNISWLNLL